MREAETRETGSRFSFLGRGDKRNWEQSGEPASHEWQLWERGEIATTSQLCNIGQLT